MELQEWGNSQLSCSLELTAVWTNHPWGKGYLRRTETRAGGLNHCCQDYKVGQVTPDTVPPHIRGEENGE
jgi:hypothetical protein